MAKTAKSVDFFGCQTPNFMPTIHCQGTKFRPHRSKLRFVCFYPVTAYTNVTAKGGKWNER